MASANLLQTIDLSPEPDLHPLYPTVASISPQISSNSGLDPSQRSKLVAHCLSRACAFGDIAMLQYLLTDSNAQHHVDLGIRDEDGVGLVSLTIHGFGGDLDRDVEREECVRLLVSQGADMAADHAGWTPLHYAAILAPPTLISYLMTHGCSPFALTNKNLTPLDIVTAHSVVPGKEDVALLLEEAMRGQGWEGGRMEQSRRSFDLRMKKKGKRREVRERVGKILGVEPSWWKKDSEPDVSDSDSDSGEDEDADDSLYTPRLDYTSMLVFSPPVLPQIFESLITNYTPKFQDATPANTLYMLARFACLTCDHTWLEDLIIGATDAIEETFFTKCDELSCLVFWLYNTTLWLHLLQCDSSIREACEILGSFEIIEEVINSVFVFIIRFAERRVDQLLDDCILSYTPVTSDLDSVQFESEWSFLRTFTSKRKPPPSPSKSAFPSSPPPSYRPVSPTHSTITISSSASRPFSSLRQTFSRATGQTTPLASLFQEPGTSSPGPSPTELISFLTALHSMLLLSDINPAIITQLWSQVMYWTSCEIFNRVITRKKYICRSRALQISMNLSIIEEWIEDMGIPTGVALHFSPVKDLFNWLQSLSSITDFADLVATIQKMKSINPLQMRRAVRDYKYEVNEGRMTDECIQYLTQLQKDWERHRVKLGVEAMKKEMGERDRDNDTASISSVVNDSASVSGRSPSLSISETYQLNRSIDILFDKSMDKSAWEPLRPPQALGELLESRHMLPLLFPSDPKLLAALPGKDNLFDDTKRASMQSSYSGSSRGSIMGTPLSWKTKYRKVRQTTLETLGYVDGVRSTARWARPLINEDFADEDDDEGPPDFPADQEANGDDTTMKFNTHLAPLTDKPTRGKNRLSVGGDTTPIKTTFSHQPEQT